MAARVDPVLGEIRRERRPPGRLPLGVGRCGARWQKKFTLNGFVVCALIAASSSRMASSPSSAQGSEPRPPALETATASALP